MFGGTCTRSLQGQRNECEKRQSKLQLPTSFLNRTPIARAELFRAQQA
jgi:hypothetical protein